MDPILHSNSRVPFSCTDDSHDYINDYKLRDKQERDRNVKQESNGRELLLKTVFN